MTRVRDIRSFYPINCVFVGKARINSLASVPSSRPRKAVLFNKSAIYAMAALLHYATPET